MPLRVDNTEITQLYVDGKECKVLYINGTAYFGKKYTLTASSNGVGLAVKRIQSPYQRAAIGNLSIGAAVYEGDILEVVATAYSGYTNAKLYANIGDGSGEKLRNNVFRFTVVGNVVLRGAADKLVLFSGAKYFTDSGRFAVSGLTTDMDVAITARATFKEDVVYFNDTSTTNVDIDVTQKQIPTSIHDNNAYIYISYADGEVRFEFCPFDGVYKGEGVRITPIQLMITEVRKIL